MLKMKHMMLTASILGTSLLVACAGEVEGSSVEITDVAVADLPQSVQALVQAQHADFDPQEIQKKVRDGRVYYDIEGTLGNGAEIEFDVLMTETGPEIVEIQRDLEFDLLPDAVKTLALETSAGVMPARIIESLQPDGAIIYEFFAPDQPSDPAYEIKSDGGLVTLLDERWIH